MSEIEVIIEVNSSFSVMNPNDYIEARINFA